MRSKGVWIAFFIGIGAGAAVALLYAPQSGTRTRRQLRKNLDEGVGYLEDAAAYLKEQAENLSAEAQKTIQRTRLDTVVDRATGAVGTAVKGVQALM
jgi:gas vesicle protein